LEKSYFDPHCLLQIAYSLATITDESKLSQSTAGKKARFIIRDQPKARLHRPQSVYSVRLVLKQFVANMLESGAFCGQFSISGHGAILFELPFIMLSATAATARSSHLFYCAILFYACINSLA
jgi:hypothetical protein